MKNTAEQFAATNKANLQALQGFTAQAFSGLEKLVELNLAASKAVMEESFGHAQAVLSAKDAKELLALQTGLVKPMADKSTAYAQHVQAILTGSTADFTKAVEAKAAEAQKAFTGALDNLTKNAPAGSESAVAAFKNALTASQTALETAQVQAKKAMETAQTSFNAAATQAADAIKKDSQYACENTKRERRQRRNINAGFVETPAKGKVRDQRMMMNLAHLNRFTGPFCTNVAPGIARHQPADRSQHRHIKDVDRSIDLAQPAQGIEQPGSDQRADNAACRKEQAHPEINAATFPVRQHPRNARACDLCRGRCGCHRGRNAKEDQQWRCQESAADPEHA